MPIDFHSSDPDHKHTERFLKKTSGRLISWRKNVQALEQYFEMPKMKAHMGTIDPQIIRSNPKPQPGRLTSLPRELGSVIWEYLDEPGDRLMLALTCKYNAGMYEELKNVKGQPSMIKSTKKTGTTPKTAKAAAKPQGVKKRSPNPPLKGTKTETMTILRRLQPWMKDTQALCYTCARYKDTKDRCDVRDFSEQGRWGGKPFSATGETDKGRKITMKLLESEGRRCPLCVVRTHVDLANTSTLYKQIKTMLAAHA